MKYQGQGKNLLRLPEVMAKTGKCRSAIYADISKGTFPAQLRISPSGRTSAWLESEIEDWIAARVAERDAERGAQQ